ncbi:MAG TPA: carbonic anhydrase [Sphingobacteriaceae bacterium]
MRTKERILLESKAWRQEKLALDHEYFTRLNEMHQPKILWICPTDSLASVREMTNTDPGDIIIYGNLGAQIKQDDESLMAVIEEAVTSYQVTQIIICGYSHCKAISQIVRGTTTSPYVRSWLKDLQDLYNNHYPELREHPHEKQEAMLSELNIREQVIRLSKVPCVQKAWEKRDFPEIYGWYLDLKTGTLQEVFSLEKNHRLKQLSSLADDSSGIKVTAS